MKYYNFDLVKRFISDYALPIQLIDSQSYFENRLELYEDEFKAETLWNKLEDVIDNKFNGTVQLFLDNFYAVRENIIQSVKNSPEFQEFNQCNMEKYQMLEIDEDYGTNEIYKGNNIGKYYISIDLSKANYQALRYCGVIKEPTYQEFIGKFTDLDYIKDSKYLRSVVFGQLNPKRHITVEKYLVSKIYNFLKHSGKYSDLEKDAKLVSILNDELIFEVPENLLKMDYTFLKTDIKNELGLDCKVEQFRLDMYALITSKGKVVNFFKKIYIPSGQHTLHCLPINYFAIAYNLLFNLKPKHEDFLILNDGFLSKIIEEFRLGKYTKPGYVELLDEPII